MCNTHTQTQAAPHTHTRAPAKYMRCHAASVGLVDVSETVFPGRETGKRDRQVVKTENSWGAEVPSAQIVYFEALETSEWGTYGQIESYPNAPQSLKYRPLSAHCLKGTSMGIGRELARQDRHRGTGWRTERERERESERARVSLLGISKPTDLLWRRSW